MATSLALKIVFVCFCLLTTCSGSFLSTRRLFDELWRDPFFSWNRQLLDFPVPSASHPAASGSLSTWSPLTDISETDQEFLIHCELPGLKKEDVSIELTDNKVLKISGERSSEEKEEDKERKFSRVERSFGRFVRSFSLPQTVQEKDIDAKMKDGLLEIKIAKRLEQLTKEPKKIPISHWTPEENQEKLTSSPTAQKEL